MRIWLFCFFISATNLWALEAVVTVLETPMLKSKSLDAPVVQYLRKGDVIKIDPSLNNETKFDHLAPSPEKLAELQKKMKDSPEWDDPFFKDDSTPGEVTDEFIKTLDRQGNIVYVIRDHLYIYFTNEKEIGQTTLKKDPTDYRLQEPLPPTYPIYSPSGYRGQFTLGVAQPYTESYPYLSNVKTKGYMNPVDVNATLLRRTADDKQDRYFFGVSFNLRVHKNTYTLFNGVRAEETGLKFGLGPLITYDAFKGLKNRVNLYGGINVYLFNQLIINQSKGSAEEERKYNAFSLAPRIGVQYHRKQIMKDVDFVVGTSMEMEPATTFRSSSAAKQQGWWVNRGSDKFNARTTFTLAGYIGFQAAY